MEPWVVDAKDINIKDEIEFFEENLLLVSPAIDRFLSEANKTETIVVAPKGYGKTLLLKAKRIRYAKSHPELIPQNALIDKPSGSPSSLKHSEYQTIRNSEAYWKSLWLLAITIPILRYLKADFQSKSHALKEIMQTDISSPCDVFKFLLGISRGEYFAAVDEYNFNIVPRVRKLHSPIAMFIDNVDEFFEDMISVGDSGITNDLYQNYWYYSQIGLALAARDITAINNHVKVYVSIRKEVFQKSFQSNPLSIQLSGSSVDIRYSKTELVKILENNIKIESRRRLETPESSSQIERFFGQKNQVIYHAATGDEERIEDYLGPDS